MLMPAFDDELRALAEEISELRLRLAIPDQAVFGGSGFTVRTTSVTLAYDTSQSAAPLSCWESAYMRASKESPPACERFLRTPRTHSARAACNLQLSTIDS